ncbi:hypothetical protein [Ligilactobacillus salivarius]|uniref:hypothetical protein n=1 Tax=Ligilactobacillus salivarius TaxID=1624 RepID=UPI001F5063F3|nr:hypothetical protein [Ligilactobacillus salivarius]
MIKVQATVQDKQAKLTQAQKNQADAQKDYDKTQADYETKITQNKEAKEALAEFVTQEQEKKADNV